MTEERQQQIDDCIAEIKRVGKWPEWPFSLGNISGVIGGLIGAVAPQLPPPLISVFQHWGKSSA